MLANPPVLTYNHPHHWLWFVRRLGRIAGFLLLWIGLDLCCLSISFFSRRIEWQISSLGLFGVLLCLGAGYCAYLVLDWKSRTIHLYSDGRLEYEYGIIRRRGTSVSMRFGAVRYIYHNRMALWLDCADLILPFESGRIDAIAEFRHFWNIAQGRM